MKTTNLAAASLIMASAILAGCASPTQPVSSTASTYPSSGYANTTGVIDSIQVVQTSTGSNGTLGTVAGGVVGGLLGNQVGSGNGRTAATVAGAVGGAMVGSQMQRNTAGGAAVGQAYQVGVRLDNGTYQVVQQESVGDLQVGSRVRIENGRVYRY